MLLSELLALPLSPQYDRPIQGLSLDSRAVQPGDLFFALSGTRTHGEIYIATALAKEAVAVLREIPAQEPQRIEFVNDIIPIVHMPTLTQRVGEIAARFFNQPTQDLEIIGVTGTNGKTSVSHFIAQTLHQDAPCGLLGTLGYGVYGQLEAGLHTTPDAIQLQRLFAQFRTQGIKQVVMEVSSHALDQGRVNGIRFTTAVFTNLSRDHLDYHQTMQAYGEAKSQLFKMPGLKTAVLNLDDSFTPTILKTLPHSVQPLTYSTQTIQADVVAHILSIDTQGCHLEIFSPWGKSQLHSPLFGRFNVSNLLAALTTLLNLGLAFDIAINRLQQVRTVAGRMERFGHSNQPTVIVDYAHTPDALEKVLLALREHLAVNQVTNISAPADMTNKGQLWCVFGCGGNRDKGKRPLMGKVAQHYADKVIITDDNPRHESSDRIINDILVGCPYPTAVIADRAHAIRYVLQQASIGDVILIAGKGHEDYQQIGDQRLPFSDSALVKTLLG